MIPTTVDCIVVGTGLTNAIIAAACSRIGKSTLHLDKNSYYGNEWASFTFQQLTDWIRALNPEDESLNNIPQELVDKSRMFCIDLCPRLLYSDGPLVELLVKSNVSRYHEFKNNIRILSMVGDEIHVIPCQRSDVFNSPLLSNLIDKRRLMKFIELCVEHSSGDNASKSNEIAKNADKPIKQFLEEKGLNETLRAYIINSIAMVDPSESTLKACDSIKRFMIATEKYGRSPFLFPLYGCGEFPQSFCRLSAVFGGIYRLNSGLKNLEMKSTNSEKRKEDSTSENGLNFKVEVSTDNYVESQFLVVDQDSAFDLKLSTQLEDNIKMSRAIIVTNTSLLTNEANMISFMRIASTDSINKKPIHLLELNSSVMVAPPGYSVVYLWCQSSALTPEAELKPAIEKIFRNKPQSIVWKYFFQQKVGSHYLPQPTNNLFVTQSPCNDIDYEHSIKEAERIFSEMYPDLDFLPRAPDPEEIISDT